MLVLFGQEQDGGQIPKGGKNKGGEWKRKTADQRNSHEPDFSAEAMDFHGVTGAIPELSFVRYVETIFLPGSCVPQHDHATLHDRSDHLLVESAISVRHSTEW